MLHTFLFHSAKSLLPCISIKIFNYSKRYDGIKFTIDFLFGKSNHRPFVVDVFPPGQEKKEIRGQRSEIRHPISDVRPQTSDFQLLTSDF